MGNYLTNNLSSTGIEKSDVLVAKDLEQMTDYLANGRVDLLSETAFSVMRLETQAGVEIILHE